MSEFVEIKTTELTGAALDWAVGCAVRKPYEGFGVWAYSRDAWLIDWSRQAWACYCPSTDWSQGGPLILNYGVSLRCIAPVNAWEADRWDDSVIPSRLVEIEAETPLIAACRAIVASVLGETVSVPKELV
jgi:hypothetical protein